jgi:short-subunit dehydrogenase
VIIKDAVALVTGGSAGIGAAVAAALAARGARVLVHGRDPAATAAVAGATAGTPIVADLAEAAEVDRLAAEALAVAGRLDILVANAGAGWAGPFAEMLPTDIDRLVTVNLTAPVRLTRALLPALRERGGYAGYVTSIAGRTGVAGEAVYAATKAGLDVFAESLRLELRGTGVRVGVLVPGVVDTAFFERRGRPYGRSWPRPLPVAPVAAALVRMIETDRAEAYRPRWARLPVAVRGALPGVYRALAGRFGGG